MLSIAILCGGYSRRFGKDKSFHMYKGIPLYRHAYDKLLPMTDDIFIQCGKKDAASYSEHSNNDDYLDLGPIGGIYSALKHAKYKRMFIVGCDMPNITRVFVSYLDKMKNDIVVPSWRNGNLEPLCAIYSKKVISLLEYNILNENFKISSIYDHFDVKKVGIESLIEQGFIKASMFKNINRPTDL